MVGALNGCYSMLRTIVVGKNEIARPFQSLRMGGHGASSYIRRAFSPDDVMALAQHGQNIINAVSMHSLRSRSAKTIRVSRDAILKHLGMPGNRRLY